MGKCIWKGKTPSQYQQKINKEIKIKLVSEILQSLKFQMIFMNIGSRCMKNRISDKNLWAPLKIFQTRILLGYVLYSGLTRWFHWFNQRDRFDSRVFWYLYQEFLRGETKNQWVIYSRNPISYGWRTKKIRFAHGRRWFAEPRKYLAFSLSLCDCMCSCLMVHDFFCIPQTHQTSSTRVIWFQQILQTLATKQSISHISYPNIGSITSGMVSPSAQFFFFSSLLSELVLCMKFGMRSCACFTL